MHWDQAEYDLRCEWGLAGVATLAPVSDVLIIVDVLVFSTSVEIAVARGASVLPYRWRDHSAAAFARGADGNLGIRAFPAQSARSDCCAAVRARNWWSGDLGATSK
jgi:2-phosphosulfolactate phosphatase